MKTLEIIREMFFHLGYKEKRSLNYCNLPNVKKGSPTFDFVFSAISSFKGGAFKIITDQPKVFQEKIKVPQLSIIVVVIESN